jgi:large subunit ribosomal protein L25
LQSLGREAKNTIKGENMNDKLQLTAEIRADVGKGASRRLRREGKIPAILYGTEEAPQTLIFNHNHITKAMENEDFFSQIFTLNIMDKPVQVVLKDIQHHVYKSQITHLDFMRINAAEKITMHIPLHFVGEAMCPGIKLGGILSRTMPEVELRCLPIDLPRFIEIDISTMQLNDTVHLSDLKIPANIELLSMAHGDRLVATVHLARMAEEIVSSAPVTTEGAEVTSTAEGEKSEEKAETTKSKTEAKPKAEGKTKTEGKTK